MNVPPAQLTPAIASENPEVQFKHEMYEIRWCHFFGVPYVMLQSPIEILQSTNGKEVAIATPLRNPSRHIYTDGRGHVSPETFDPASGGNSIGHWEGETLVVDTIGFSEEGIMEIPGGGWRTKIHIWWSGSAWSAAIGSRSSSPGKIRRSMPSRTATKFVIFGRPFTELREFDCNAADETRQDLLEPPGSELK